MIVAQDGQVANSNIDERTEFKIRANAKAFKLLSSNLYNDKPLAIVREIGCNALDSHFMAGKVDTPFKLVLPSELHPWLEITDYGTGLSHDQVTNVFTTYFESTKTESNDQIGAMGLGSKSPFSYTDAFEVIARQKGVQNQYTCFLNQSGAPEIFRIETTESPEYQDGVTIKVPIKKNDFHLFRQAAQNAYRFFPVKPTVAGDVQWNTPTFGFEGTNFKTLTNDNKIYALMGPVAYPIDMNLLEDAHPFIQKYKNLTGHGFLITYPIGALDVNAGREGLSYDKTTIANLIAGMDSIRDEMAGKLEGEMAVAKTLYEAVKIRMQKDARDVFQLRWNGKPVDAKIVYKFRDSVGDEQWQVRTVSTKWAEKLASIRSDNVNVYPSDEQTFVLVDERALHTKRIRYSKEDLKKCIFLVSPSPDKTPNKDQFAEVIDMLEADGVPWRYLSDIAYEFPPKPPRAKRDPNAPKTARPVVYGGFYFLKQASMTWPVTLSGLSQLDAEDMTKDYVYIKYNATGKRIHFGASQVKPSDTTSTIWEFVEAEMTKRNMRLVVVTSKGWDKIPEEWIDAHDIIKDAIKPVLSITSFREVYGDYPYTGFNMSKEQFEEFEKSDKIHDLFKTFVTRIRGITFGDDFDYRTQRFIRNVYNVSTSDSVTDDSIANFVKALTTAHPFIERYMNNKYGRWSLTDMTELTEIVSALIKAGVTDPTILLANA